MKLVAKRFTINLLIYFIIAAIAACLVYKYQAVARNSELEQREKSFQEKHEAYRTQVAELSQYISMLNSRIKHLSKDNHRLSQTGNKLVEKIEQSTSSISEKFSEVSKLQLELTKLDDNIMHKYDAYIAQQNASNNLKISCKQGSGKSKKCEEYQASLDVLDNVSLQLKYLKARREALQTSLNLYTPQ